jgi:hypothetical protein
MRTLEEVKSELKAIKAEMAEIAAAEANVIASPYVETMLRYGLDEIHIVIGRDERNTRYLSANLKDGAISLRLESKIRDAGGHTTRNHTAEFDYDTNSGRWSVSGNIKAATDALEDWTSIARADAAARQAERDELAFEAARAAEREDPDYIAPVLETGADHDDFPDPFTNA